MTTSFILIAALLIDLWLGKPRRQRPLSAFARLAARSRLALEWAGLGGGALGFLLLVLPFALALNLLARLDLVGVPLGALVLALGLGATGLVRQGELLSRHLLAGEFSVAAERLGWLRGRGAPLVAPARLARESCAELLRQGSEGVFAVVFWFLAAGPGGVVALRLTQLLAREWGSGREFGATARLAARLFHLPAAPLAALTYLLLADRRGGWSAWRRPGEDLATRVGLGALGIHEAAGPAEVARAARLLRHGVMAWAGLIVAADSFIQ